jgi:hypothetical protein
MVISEKFKYYHKLGLLYLSMRFSVWRFGGLSVLLVFLGYQGPLVWTAELKKLAFVFLSLLVFRWMDDVWSFHIDRIDHPERTYLQTGHLKGMIALGGFLFIVYQTGLFLLTSNAAPIMPGLFAASGILYLISYRNRIAMTVIPLLKYPVMIWILSKLSMNSEVLLLSAGAFFMMLSADLKYGTLKPAVARIIRSGLLLLTGFLILQPWAERANLWLDLSVILLAPVILLPVSLNKSFILPIIIFPLAHLTDVIL